MIRIRRPTLERQCNVCLILETGSLSRATATLKQTLLSLSRKRSWVDQNGSTTEKKFAFLLDVHRLCGDPLRA